MHRRTFARVLLSALAAGFLVAAPARAQAVHGRLVDPAGRPVEQVLVALVDAQGRPAGGALTSAAGEFHIRAPGAGRYSLRAERVGYATVTTPAFALADGETREERLVASGRAVMLAAVVVAPGRRRCAVRPGAGMATATLWEEARKALAAAEFASRAGLFRYDLVRWERQMGTGGGTVTRDERQPRTGVAQLPFVAVPPEELSRKGFIFHLPGDTLVYAAPDASVLLSDEFLDDHCFRVATGGDPTLVGLEFEPVAGRTVPDVHGVLWLDRASAELRRVEYRYVNGPPESRDPAVGGSVEFERLRGGPWIVRRWAIRMPVAEVVSRTLSVNGGGIATRTLNVRAVQEAGGEVTSARRVDGGGEAAEAIAGAAAPAMVEGVVWDSVARAPLASAHVFLSGTGAEAVADADGRYRLRAPAAGSYAITFTHPALGPVSAAVAPRTVTAVAGQTARADLAVPAPARVAAALCPAETRRNFAGVVTGRVVGVALDSVAVRATWRRFDVTAHTLGSTQAWSETRPDAAGFYVLCDVPEDVPVEVAVNPVRPGTQRRAAPPAEALARVEVTVARGVPLRVDVGPDARRP
ncbi:MAG: carboxypeptidase regulatory-like domain-containing protein [Longimicrobiaceae bacterium]